jgi:hypothetical protein
VFRCASGATTLELVFAMTVALVVASVSLATAAEWRHRSRAVAAARTVLAHVRLARAYAVRDGAHVALLFQRSTPDDVAFRMHRDGNGNGVRRSEAERGIDPAQGPAIRLAETWPGTALRVGTSAPGIEDDTQTITAGSSPVRLSGGSMLLSFAPAGTATAGTIYVGGRTEELFAIRVLGTTGRVRMFEYSPRAQRWWERW